MGRKTGNELRCGMKPIIVDMDLSPLWGEVLRRTGLEAMYWSSVGKATDEDIFKDFLFNTDNAKRLSAL